MSDDNKIKPPKKGIPGGFFILLVSLILAFFTIQSLRQEKNAKVSFSYQVEHLVNLDLLQKEQSRKIALNDNLVSFSGKFKDHLTEQAKERYRYLQLLNTHHEIAEQEADLTKNLKALKSNVQIAADWFLHLSGLPLPEKGYVVVSSLYDEPGFESAIVLHSLSDRDMPSLSSLQQRLVSLNPGDYDAFAQDLNSLIQGFRSPNLGIGSESMKQTLRDLSNSLQAAPAEQRLTTFQMALNQLDQIVQQLNMPHEEIRLLDLRSVRSYQQDLLALQKIESDLASNSAELDKARSLVADVIWFFNNKELSTRALESQDPEQFSQWFTGATKEWEQFSASRGATFRAPDQPRNAVLDKTFRSEEPSPNYLSYFLTILPVLLIVFLLYFVFSKQMKGVGTGAMTFGKAPARMLTKDRNKVTFKDVAGCDEAKEELQEIVEFLKNPAKFTALGARIPKGVLCIGAPGTGKTLIARAVAGEADRPFFSISGSDFVEMFVGVGASRVRDLFDQAKKNAPCIIFMDEIDAVGRHRGAGIGGGHDEREQTLNQLLVEMDGFDTTEGVILIAATNRPDVLDKALLRPGRFDRRIVIDLPDIRGRFEILKVHARKIKLDPSVDLMTIARNTPGASGADLANILNEAALLAARKGRSAVTAQDASEACDKVRYGKERRSLEIDSQEKRTTAIHESGHAIVGLVVKYADPVDKVTIIPRGLSLGATHFLPTKNKLSYWKKELSDRLAVLMGGRIAEEMFVGDLSSGAQMDISQATRLVRSMVCEWGMTDLLGSVAYDERSESGQYLGLSNYQDRSYSEDTAEQIDAEMRMILKEANQTARKILEENRDKLLLMTDMLMKYETLERQDVLDIMAGQWDIEKKDSRLKAEAELQKTPPKSPPIPPKTDLSPQQT
jgi:cell division protease FtsH